MSKQELIFISGPYSHKSETVVKQRVSIFRRVSALLIDKGVNAICPTVYGSSLLEHKLMTNGSWAHWQPLCLSILEKCTAMYIIDILGWRESQGVKDEIRFCEKNNIPIFLLNPKTLEIDDIHWFIASDANGFIL